MAKKNIRSYSDFSLTDLRTICGISNKKERLGLMKQLGKPSEWLETTLQKNEIMPVNSEKARSELLITPVLIEWLSQNPKKLQYFSGNAFNVEPSKALKGRCDFLFTKSFSMDIVAPVVAMFEAKDENVDNWYGQCGAEMFAARLFNERSNEPYRIIFGAVTDGFEWVFLKLEDDILTVDLDRYYLKNLPELLGALQTIIEFYD